MIKINLIPPKSQSYSFTVEVSPKEKKGWKEVNLEGIIRKYPTSKIPRRRTK